MQKGQNKFKQQSILGIVTCNREDMLEKLVESIDRDCVEKIFIINNGAALKNNYDGIEVLQSKREFTPVGVGKNRFWREARNINPNAWLFTLEDDITILDNNVFERYISTALDSGICGQLSYGLHGGIAGGNVGEDGTPIKRATVKYTKWEVDFYKHSVAAFSLMHGSVVSSVGYNNEQFTNAAEHLDHYLKMYYDIRVKGTPFFWFPDIKDSFEFIADQDSNHERSAIRSQPEFMQHFSQSWGLFKQIHKVLPTQIEDTSSEGLMQRLTEIELVFANKNLI